MFLPHLRVAQQSNQPDFSSLPCAKQVILTAMTQFAKFEEASFMFDHISPFNRGKRKFDDQEVGYLGLYIYALQDPRDSKIFYIGQGRGSRMYSHFEEAERVLKGRARPTSKTLRIIDIWAHEEDVSCFFIASMISDTATANKLESAAAEALSISQNGPVLNSISTPDSSFLTLEQLKSLACKPINPEKPYESVFVFPIHGAIAEGKTVYEACRSAWTVTEKYRNRPHESIAVGLVNGISKEAFRIQSWTSRDDGKAEFQGEVYENLSGLSFQRVIDVAKGYWQRGNYLVVEFDGAGRFKINRGSSSNNWHSCLLQE